MPPSAQPLRLVLAIGIYEPEKGGAAEWLRDYARWLLDRGHQVCIVCERAESPAPAGGTLRVLPLNQHTKNSWRRAQALQKLAAEQRAVLVHDTGCLLAADVLHPLMGSLTHNWYRQLAAFPLPLRLRRFWHVRLWRDVRLQWHQRRRNRRLVACSQRVASDFQQFGSRELIIIPNGIRLPVERPAEALADLRQELDVGDRLLILVTATNFYLKGVMTVLRALSRMNPETRKKFLVVITGHNKDKAFAAYIHKNDLSDGCRLVGWVKDVEPYYEAADIFLHPTYHDAGSLSTLKALAAGCAVVTSRFDGSADLIQPGINGLVLNRPDDPEELAKTVEKLLEPELRKRLGAAARELRPILDQENQFARLEALYVALRSEALPGSPA